jgi:hypothetical protein
MIRKEIKEEIWDVDGKFKLAETEKGETAEEKCQQHALTSQGIRPGRPNSQFRIPVRRFTPTAW